MQLFRVQRIGGDEGLGYAALVTSPTSFVQRYVDAQMFSLPGVAENWWFVILDNNTCEGVSPGDWETTFEVLSEVAPAALYLHTASSPGRALNSTFTPSATRPTLVSYSARVTTNVLGGVGRVELLSDAASPPTTVRGRVAAGGLGAVSEGMMTYLVPAGHNVHLATVTESGVVTPTLTAVHEQQL